MADNYQIVDFKPTKNLSDDELANIEGPRAVLFLMFDEWQPAGYTIRRLYHLGISKEKIIRYLVSFKKFYMGKTKCFYYKTEWNSRFISHCERNKEWEN